MSDAPLRFDGLLDAMCERPLVADEIAAVERLASADPAARRRLVALLSLDAALRWEQAGANSDLGTRNVDQRVAFKLDSSPSRTPTLRPPKRLVLPLAAALLLAAAAVAIVLISLNSKPETRDPKPLPPVATVTDTHGGTLVVDEAVLAPGDEFKPGAISLDLGSAELRLGNGVEVHLAGPTRLSLDTPLNATLVSGSVSFVCPPGVTGYTVYLPHGVRVIDLGTAFRIDTDADGRSHVTVTEGRVRVERPGGASFELAAGESIGIDLTGTLMPIDKVALVGMAVAPEPIVAYRDGDARELTLDRELPAFTIAAWVRFDALSANYNALLMSDGWGAPGQLHWQVYKGRLQLAIFSVSDETSPHFYADAPLPLGRPVHLAVTLDRDAGAVAYYIDGKAVPVRATRGYLRPHPSAEMAAAATARLANASVGRWVDPVGRSSRQLDGRVESLTIYAVPLDADAIARAAERRGPN